MRTWSIGGESRIRHVLCTVPCFVFPSFAVVSLRGFRKVLKRKETEKHKTLVLKCLVSSLGLSIRWQGHQAEGACRRTCPLYSTAFILVMSLIKMMGYMFGSRALHGWTDPVINGVITPYSKDCRSLLNRGCPRHKTTLCCLRLWDPAFLSWFSCYSKREERERLLNYGITIQ